MSGNSGGFHHYTSSKLPSPAIPIISGCKIVPGTASSSTAPPRLIETILGATEYAPETKCEATRVVKNLRSI